MKKQKKMIFAVILCASLLLGITGTVKRSGQDEGPGFNPWVPPLGITYFLPLK